MQLQIFRKTFPVFPEQKEINGIEYPIIVHYSDGRTASARVRGGSLIFRIPRKASHTEAESMFNGLLRRIERGIIDGSGIQKPFIVHDNEVLQVMGNEFRIAIQEKAFSVKRAYARLSGSNTILVSVSSSLPSNEQADLASRSVKRLISKIMLNAVEGRIRDINNAYYNFDFSTVSISRINTTRWGSCSPSKGRINLDFRLLFAPQSIMDSVIVHELCHLKVSRHNRRFWGLVYRAMPDYKERRRWLNRNGNMLGQGSLHYTERAPVVAPQHSGNTVDEI
ncbi:MAG: M48 family metallopeptidase [Candidatus Marsarchaeota archaeon]|nr:M48 family metallopeptidase [Candidatus Marsarchaeota archaeon]